MVKRTRFPLLALIAALAIATGLWFARQANVPPPDTAPQDRATLGIMTSLPIYWPEGVEFTDALDDARIPPVRRELERRYRLTPLDTLSPEAADQAGPLAEMERLMIVQPRGLSAADNVALDQWVRGGGRLLYVLDPMLAGQYSFPVSDPRHPTAVGLIPPVITRWGLTMEFDQLQPMAMRRASYGKGDLPVLMYGKVQLREDAAGESAEARDARGDCQLLGSGIAAQCTLGEGRVTLIADAALFEFFDYQKDAPAQLRQLAEFAFE